jgi:hypothetical protein
MIPRKGDRIGRGSLVGSIVLLGMVSGCMNSQLRLTARLSTNALHELQYQQVMDNLAAIASHPHLLPYLAVAGQGSIQVTDTANSSFGMNMAHKTFTTGIVSLSGSRNVTANWNMGTVTSPEKIREMQSHYQRAVRGRAEGDPDYAWLNVGSRRDVPKGASFIGRHGPVFVWVMPDGIEGLSNLTLAIMDIATREEVAPVPRPPAAAPPEALAPGVVPRRNFQVPAPGPVFTPGVN